MIRHGSDNPSPEFRLRLRASADDIDELGHVSNVAYVRWIQDVAVAHSTAVGWPREAYQACGAIFVVRKHEVEYLGSAVEGDELELVTHVAWWRAAVSERRTHIHRVRDGALLTKASTLWAYIKLESGRPMRIPKELERAFYEQPLVAPDGEKSSE